MKTLFSIFALTCLCLAQNHVTIRDSAGTVQVSGYLTFDAIAVGISAPSTSVPSGGQMQFVSAVVNAQDPSVTWTSTLGSIDSTGLLTAPVVTADQQLTVTVSSVAGATKSASLTVTVVAPVPPPPPPPPPPPSGSSDGPAALPKVFLTTSLSSTPAQGKITPVTAATLQTALNAASCGDTLMLQAGSTSSTGNVYTFPAKPCDDSHWIIVRTSTPDASLPTEGTRMTPCYAGVASLPGRPAYNCPNPQNVLAKIVYTGSAVGPINFAAGANHYRLIGLEITRTVGSGTAYQLLGGSGDKIIVDRSWLHGTAQDETALGIQLSGFTNFAAIDSYFSDFHCTSVTGSGCEGHAIGGGTGGGVAQGPYKITDNFIEAGGQGIMFGGGAAGGTPSDIEIRGNHFFKPLTWLKGQANFVGGTSGNPFMVKNHLELKNAQRVLIEGNIFENNWGGFTQSGWAILLTPKNQAGANGSNLCPNCLVEDVTIRYSTISHSGGGIEIANAASDNGGIAAAGQRYSIHDITMDDLDPKKYVGTGVLFQMLNGWPTNSLNSILIDHITAFPDPATIANGGLGKIISLGNATTNPPMTGLTFTNSIIGTNAYQIWSTGQLTNCAIPNMPKPSLDSCFPAGYVFQKNLVIGVNQANFPVSSIACDPLKKTAMPCWPANNYTANGTAAIPLSAVSFASFATQDYHLLPNSPYKNAGLDGRDLGADIDAIQAATAGAQ